MTNSISYQELENSFARIYNFFNSDQTRCIPHSSKPVYFCSEEKCSKCYICSECLIEQPDHFAEHYKFLLPIDDKKKFFKFLKFPIEDIISQLSTAQSEKVNEIETFYSNLKAKVNEIIDKHSKEYSDAIKLEINKKKSSNNSQKLSSDIEVKVNKFIKQNNKNEIQKFIKEIKEDFDNILNKKRLSLDFDNVTMEIRLNDIIKSNIQKIYGIKLNQNNNANQKQIAVNNIIEGVKEKKVEIIEGISESSSIQKQTVPDINSINSLTLNKSKNLEIIQEVIESEQVEESEEQVKQKTNIKNRLDLLKKKIENLK